MSNNLEIPQEFQYLYAPGYNSITKIPKESLRKKCDNVLVVSLKTRELINRMIKEMRSNNGVGLAAPQVGVNQNIIVVGIGDKPIVMINPVIVEGYGPLIESEEGCLSIPGLYGYVVRTDSIRVQALDKKGKMFEMKLQGLSARVVQHEVDHLNGILFIDRANPETLHWKHPEK